MNTMYITHAAYTNLNAQNLVETTAKEFSAICITKHLSQQSYTPQQLAGIKTIAELCPYTHGYAVYLARTIMAEFDSVFVEYQDSCEEFNEQNNGRFGFNNDEKQELYNIEESENWQVYPIPTSNYLFVTTTIVNPKSRLILFNLLGDIILDDNITNQVTSLNTSQLPNGLYYIQIIDNSQLIFKTKVVVVH